ncbi:MAG: hypothetical protein Q7S89_02015 [bacterium]|nr:hypothetical protein [bacterium]
MCNRSGHLPDDQVPRLQRTIVTSTLPPGALVRVCSNNIGSGKSHYHFVLPMRMDGESLSLPFFSADAGERLLGQFVQSGFIGALDVFLFRQELSALTLPKEPTDDDKPFADMLASSNQRTHRGARSVLLLRGTCAESISMVNLTARPQGGSDSN